MEERPRYQPPEEPEEVKPEQLDLPLSVSDFTQDSTGTSDNLQPAVRVPNNANAMSSSTKIVPFNEREASPAVSVVSNPISLNEILRENLGNIPLYRSKNSNGPTK
jgi:hypothetical protein